MKYIIVALLLLLASCNGRVTEAQWDYAEELCVNNFGLDYVVGTLSADKHRVVAKCVNGAEFNTFIDDEK